MITSLYGSNWLIDIILNTQIYSKTIQLNHMFRYQDTDSVLEQRDKDIYI
ncbi:hypothetical protein Pedsa_2748 [Pseudopedobacter saltans DSM 12145]|uniref:Uncharacterized protein n=1 Tax=Pseudopedobacter saltans (strain ATCC 51119 / DSM 12145 / JCM 21818 / CCUG 39354 / LMG 10337 / NBRC 100064 / NCIMB 13643) TaxID=762903 RepID=F0S726_PSESL|nr:hypothetical protein Pedsa_2748 [Pseudopedobacter saltans DSM 12145]